MTTKIALISFFSLALGFSALADGPLTVTPSANADTYKLTYKAAEAGKVTVTILNNDKQTVFTEVLRNVSSFVRPYNFSGLSEGQYFIKLEDKNGSHIEEIKVSRSSTSIRVRELANENQKFIMTVINNKNEKVSVRIYESQKGLLYETEMEVNGASSVLYNLAALSIDPTAVIFFEVSTSTGKVETAMF
jgi:hypothetical protein